MGEHEEEEHTIASDIFEKKPATRLEKKTEKKEHEEQKHEEKQERKEEKAKGSEGQKGGSLEGAPVVKLTINIILLSFAVFGMLAAVALYFIIDGAIDNGKSMVMGRLEIITKSIGDMKKGVEKIVDAVGEVESGSAALSSSIEETSVGIKQSGDEIKSFGEKIKKLDFGGVISFKKEGEGLEESGEELIKAANELKTTKTSLDAAVDNMKKVKENFNNVKKNLEEMEANIQSITDEMEGIFSALKTANCLTSGIFFLMFAVLLLSASKDFIHF